MSNLLQHNPASTQPARLFPPSMSPTRMSAQLDQFVQEIRCRGQSLQASTDSELAERLMILRQTTADRNIADFREFFLDSAAIATQAVQRTLGFQLHDGQIRGALAAASGSIIEMQTGEGKTVVCGVTAIMRSVFDQSVHVATTSDYLAERDHESVQPIFRLLNLTSAVIRLDDSDTQTLAAYRCDITYGPGYLFGFDYLRDQIKLKDEYSINLGGDVLRSINGRHLGEELRQPTHQSIIVDEADSVLIDESTTPLILSGSGESELNPGVVQSYLNADNVATALIQDSHFTLDIPNRKVELTNDGLDLIHEELEQHGTLDLLQPWPVYIRNALFARHLLIRDEHYVIQQGEIRLVDQNTGRIFEDRTLRGGLHQALEASEQLDINPPNRTLARVTRQRFFQLYHTICGMTGTASGSENELQHFYRSPVIGIPQNKPNKRIEVPERFFANQESRVRAVVDQIQRIKPSGQPTLIGTRTIKESLQINQALRAVGIKAVLLNGVQDQDEAEIVATAGRVGSLTIATNMAGRGTDIKLDDQARQLGGLHVIATQRHPSRRVDRQLAGRSARQGDPGSVQFFIAADDELFQKQGKALAKRIRSVADDDGESRRDFSAEVQKLQGKIEQDQFELRRRLVRQDGWMDQVRNTMANDRPG